VRRSRFDWPAFVTAVAGIALAVLLLCLLVVGCEAEADCKRRGGVYLRAYGHGYVCTKVLPP
jgi:hypothetical protein